MSDDVDAAGPTNGFVYVLSNPAMIGLLKIGCSERHPAIRAAELSSSTGVPAPFTVELFLDVTDRYKAEAAVHAALEPFCENKSREFYRINMPKLTPLLLNALSSWREHRSMAPEECPLCHGPVYHDGRVPIRDRYTNALAPGKHDLLRGRCGKCGAVLGSHASIGKDLPDIVYWHLMDDLT